MAVMIAGRQFWLWRAVDEGEVLDLSPPANGRSTPRVRATQSGRSNNPDAVDLAMRGWATNYLRRGVHRRVRVVAMDEAKSGTLAGNNSGWSIFQRRNVLLMSKQNPIRPPVTKICYFSDRLLAVKARKRG
jgi:hypothetical protein